MFRNPKFTLDGKYLENPAHCPYPKERKLLEDLDGSEDPKFDLAAFWRSAGTWLLVSVLGSLLVGIAFLQLFKRHSGAMTRATIYTQVAVPLAVGLSLLFAGQAVPGMVMFGMAGLAAFVFWLWRAEIGLASRLLGVSAHGLVANPHLITLTVVLNVLGLLSTLPLLVFSGFAYTNGAFVPNPDRAGASQCVDTQGQAVPCCAWQPEPWALGFISGASLLMLWTLLLYNQIRVFVISGTIAQWYFAAPGSSDATTKGSTTRSLGHALGPSFGSLCLSSLVLTITETLRQATENAQQDNPEAGLLQVCFYVCAQMLYSLIEYLTKFATVMTAISGDSFLTAGRRVTDLLVRNFLNTFATTVWFTPLVIQLACLSLGVAWGLLSGGAYYLLRPAGLEVNHKVNSAVLGTLSGVAAMTVLFFLGGVLLSVLDACFVCWAIDRDSQTVSQPQVYEVFMTVPLKTPQGAVVQQPGGDLAYGAEQEPLNAAPLHRPGQAYQPPVIHQGPLV
ncbi:hypothetical protein N2152v2_006064 [Parachlorella kessleri]